MCVANEPCIGPAFHLPAPLTSALSVPEPVPTSTLDSTLWHARGAQVDGIPGAPQTPQRPDAGDESAHQLLVHPLIQQSHLVSIPADNQAYILERIANPEEGGLRGVDGVMALQELGHYYAGIAAGLSVSTRDFGAYERPARVP